MAPKSMNSGWVKLSGWETWPYGSPVRAMASAEPGGQRDQDGQDVTGSSGPYLFSALFIPGGERRSHGVKWVSCAGGSYYD